MWTKYKKKQNHVQVVEDLGAALQEKVHVVSDTYLPELVHNLKLIVDLARIDKVHGGIDFFSVRVCGRGDI